MYRYIFILVKVFNTSENILIIFIMFGVEIKRARCVRILHVVVNLFKMEMSFFFQYALHTHKFIKDKKPKFGENENHKFHNYVHKKPRANTI